MVQERLHPAVYDEIQARIASIAQNQSLGDAANFVARAQALRVLNLDIVGRIDDLVDGADKGEKKRLRALKRQAFAAKALLEPLDEQLFGTFRDMIKHGNYPKPALHRTLRGYVERFEPEEWSDPPRYDHLDTFVDGLLQIASVPRAQKQPEPEMVYYQATPARIVLDMVERLSLSTDDLFYDLGSGLGRVAITTALVGDARVKGVEFEPAYVDYARRRVAALGLDRVSFINADAREVQYADGTIFFLYTPFKGKILQRVYQLLQYEARTRRIRVCSYGPGTLDVMEQDWLGSVDDVDPDIHRVAIFVSK